MSYQVINPFIQFVDPINGKPLSAGSVYFGRMDSDPKNQPANRINVYAVQDNGAEVLLSQPITLNGAGQPQYSGSVKQLKIELYAGEYEYSVQVFSKNGAQKGYSPRAEAPICVSDLSPTNSTVSIAGVAASRVANNIRASYVTIEDFGGGIGLADNSSAMNTMLATSPKWIHFGGGGGYKFLSAISYDKNIKITFANNSYIDADDGTFTGGYWLKVSGSKTQIQNLGSTANAGSRVINFLTAPSLNVGDVFIIFNPTNGSFSGWRTVYFAGEFCRVAAISGTNVTIESALYGTYTAGSVQVFRVNPVKVDIDNCFIVGNKSTSLLDVEFGVDCSITNFGASHINNSVLQFIRCYNTKASFSNIRNAGTIGDDYGVVITNSQIVRTHGGEIYSRRHAITTGGDGESCAVPCRDLIFDSHTLSNDPASDVFAADFHGNTENGKYTNCTIYGGATWQGKNNGYENCYITAAQAGWVIYSSEVVGGNLYAKECTLVTTADPSATTRGLVDIGGNNTAVSNITTQDVTFDLSGSNIVASNLSAITSLMLFRNRGATINTNLKFDNVNINANDFGQVIFTGLVSGTASARFIIADNLTCNLSGKILCNHAGGDYNNVSHRLQPQTGSTTVTTGIGVNESFGPVQNFNWIYPRLPSAQHAAVNVSYMGTILPVSNVNIGNLTTSSIRLSVASSSGANFTAATAITLNYSASIEEV